MLGLYDNRPDPLISIEQKHKREWTRRGRHPSPFMGKGGTNTHTTIQTHSTTISAGRLDTITAENKSAASIRAHSNNRYNEYPMSV